MCREIKFRAWTIVDKDYKENEPFEWFMTAPFGLGSVSGYVGNYSTSNASIGGIDGDLFWNSDLLKLMQYTGLKDKNGVEIYEGDVVVADITIDSEAREVKFHEGKFILWSNKSKYNKVWDLMPVDCCEVIGNIYEHYELTEQ